MIYKDLKFRSHYVQIKWQQWSYACGRKRRNEFTAILTPVPPQPTQLFYCTSPVTTGIILLEAEKGCKVREKHAGIGRIHTRNLRVQKQTGITQKQETVLQSVDVLLDNDVNSKAVFRKEKIENGCRYAREKISPNAEDIIKISTRDYQVREVINLPFWQLLLEKKIYLFSALI